MMRRPEGPLAGDLALRQFTREGSDHARFQHLARIHRRQDRRQALRQHGFAGARRPDHQEMMRPGRRHFEGAFAGLLAFDVLEIGQAAMILGEAGTWPRQHLRSLHVIENLDDRLWTDDIDLITRPGGFGTASPGADEAKAPGIGGNRRRQRAGHGAQGPVEAHLADHHIAVEEILRQHTQGGEHRQGNGQVIVAALLGEIGGREIDSQPFAGQRQADGE
jgi:hypothetical protein